MAGSRRAAGAASQRQGHSDMAGKNPCEPSTHSPKPTSCPNDYAARPPDARGSHVRIKKPGPRPGLSLRLLKNRGLVQRFLGRLAVVIDVPGVVDLGQVALGIPGRGRRSTVGIGPAAERFRDLLAIGGRQPWSRQRPKPGSPHSCSGCSLPARSCRRGTTRPPSFAESRFTAEAPSL